MCGRDEYSPVPISDAVDTLAEILNHTKHAAQLAALTKKSEKSDCASARSIGDSGKAGSGARDEGDHRVTE
jgi:hypothetical protein